MMELRRQLLAVILLLATVTNSFTVFGHGGGGVRNRLSRVARGNHLSGRSSCATCPRAEQGRTPTIVNNIHLNRLSDLGDQYQKLEGELSHQHQHQHQGHALSKVVNEITDGIHDSHSGHGGSVVEQAAAMLNAKLNHGSEPGLGHGGHLLNAAGTLGRLSHGYKLDPMNAAAKFGGSNHQAHGSSHNDGYEAGYESAYEHEHGHGHGHGIGNGAGYGSGSNHGESHGQTHMGSHGHGHSSSAHHGIGNKVKNSLRPEHGAGHISGHGTSSHMLDDYAHSQGHHSHVPSHQDQYHSHHNSGHSLNGGDHHGHGEHGGHYTKVDGHSHGQSPDTGYGYNHGHSGHGNIANHGHSSSHAAASVHGGSHSPSHIQGFNKYQHDSYNHDSGHQYGPHQDYHNHAQSHHGDGRNHHLDLHGGVYANHNGPSGQHHSSSRDEVYEREYLRRQQQHQLQNHLGGVHSHGKEGHSVNGYDVHHHADGSSYKDHGMRQGDHSTSAKLIGALNKLRDLRHSDRGGCQSCSLNQQHQNSGTSQMIGQLLKPNSHSNGNHNQNLMNGGSKQLKRELIGKAINKLNKYV